MVVHHVKMDHVRAGRDDRLDFLAEPRKVRGQDTRGDSERARDHRRNSTWILTAPHETACTLVSAGDFVWNEIMADTRKYEVAVSSQTQYVPEQSDEQGGRYVFAYTITIRNTGSVSAQLISRHWIITDAGNQVQEVRGLGVVGAQPLLKPGESFEYTSGTAIATPVGTMRGSYQMVAEDGTRFDATIPEFTLSVPRVLH
jgi:ApaG protein